jgi:hypothetical protein
MDILLSCLRLSLLHRDSLLVLAYLIIFVSADLSNLCRNCMALLLVEK